MSNIQVEITRDSVCMADDLHDNTKTLHLELHLDSSTTIYDIAKGYLPTVAGRGHSWSCFLNGEMVAVVDGNCIKITTLINEPNFASGSKLYFKYHAATF